MNDNFSLTIFTPIYNRERFVERLFDTILQQKCKDFEWIIVDDGSSDNTYNKIKEQLYNRKIDVTIRLFRQKNSGKQRAINFAVNHAKGKYFFVLDSDDRLVSDAVDYIKKWCEQIEQLPDYGSYAGVAGLRVHNDGSVIGDQLTESYIDATNLERKQKRLRGDKAEIYKTSILKKYPFRVFKNETFVSEATVWNMIAYDGFKIRWFNVPIYICDYLSDGLTKNALKIDVKNYHGLIYQTNQVLKMGSAKEKISSLGYLIKISHIKKVPIKKVSRKVNKKISTLLISYIIYCIYHGIRK